ncbi:MAG: sodium:solute symporter [Schleiferiaceae bacterium]|jgi:Na+/proline symporter|nr:sodium:solute symporter [Schleiferiaceae bacterium]
MHWIDWIVLLSTVLLIVGYGSWKTRKNQSIDSFLKGNNELKWHTIGLSIMATQASAITFLSTPGQAYESGMGFVQFYFGVPLAMIIVSAVFLPIYYKLNVFTAYEYLEQRFDVRIRLFTAFLFLISRGLAAGITIYAPAIILSTVLGWDLTITNIAVGVLVIIYTVSGGTKAVSLTQTWQMAIILIGMGVAFGVIVSLLPEEISFLESVEVAGILNRMEVIDTSVDLENRYTLLSGLTGGLFLALSYFGTDQSQVQRYLGGKSLKESRVGLMFNGLLKVPMQFFILFTGIMVFVFYQFNAPSVFFNSSGYDKVIHTEKSNGLTPINEAFQETHSEKKEKLIEYFETDDVSTKAHLKSDIQKLQKANEDQREEAKAYIQSVDSEVATKDSDYIFLSFILKYMPVGVIGLLLAVILSAAMSSTAGELNALASTTVVDYYKRLGWGTKNEDIDDENKSKADLKASKIITVVWGVLAIGVALVADLFDNLIQLVNILGSLFYGTILGVFLVAFFFKKVKGKAILWAAVIAELLVITIHVLVVQDVIDLGYLMYNLIGCLAVIVLALIFSETFKENREEILDYEDQG